MEFVCTHCANDGMGDEKIVASLSSCPGEIVDGWMKGDVATDEPSYIPGVCLASKPEFSHYVCQRCGTSFTRPGVLPTTTRDCEELALRLVRLYADEHRAGRTGTATLARTRAQAAFDQMLRVARAADILTAYAAIPPEQRPECVVSLDL